MAAHSKIEKPRHLRYRRAMHITAHEFRVTISYDAEVGKWYVADSEMPGLILEDADPGHLLDRLRIAANDLLKARDGDYAKELGIAKDHSVRLIPVYQPVDIAA